MSLIPEEHKEHLKNELGAKMQKPVDVLLFAQEGCQFCTQTKLLLEELAALTDKVRIQVYDLVKDGDKANQYGVDKVPALVFLGDRDYGVRFYGIPYGYEFQSLIETLINVSNGHTDLAETTKQKLKELRSFVHVQVFVTLTCPYCPMLAALAHKFAIESNLIKAEVVDVSEFPQLALKYTVMGVPKTVINEKVEFVGVVPEEQLLEHVNRALQ